MSVSSVPSSNSTLNQADYILVLDRGHLVEQGTEAELLQIGGLYKQLYDNGGYSKSAAVFELAKISDAAGKTDEAKTYYQKIVSEFPESPFRTEADQALKRLGAPAA